MSNAQYLASLVNSSGNIVLPVSNGGVVFNPSTVGTGTVSSNTMSDYETGTWTPALSKGGATFSYSFQNGYYTKTGNIVYVIASLQWLSVSGGSGTVSITGLPFTCSNGNNNYSQGSCNDFAGWNFADSGTMLGMEFTKNNTVCAPISNRNGSGTATGVSSINSSGYIYFAGFYQAQF